MQQLMRHSLDEHSSSVIAVPHIQAELSHCTMTGLQICEQWADNGGQVPPERRAFGRNTLGDRLAINVRALQSVDEPRSGSERCRRCC
jgi:hypothetical protein